MGFEGSLRLVKSPLVIAVEDIVSARYTLDAFVLKATLVSDLYQKSIQHRGTYCGLALDEDGRDG